MIRKARQHRKANCGVAFRGDYMVFITGGAYQGKKAYVKNMYANIDTMLNGRECSLGDVITARCVYNWQYLF